MLYVAVTFWLLVCMLTAWGVHRSWCAIIPVRAVNVVLLPGTLIALLGHVLGLLVTGATVTSATLYKDDGSGEPEATTEPKPRIPVIGPILIGMLPLLACGMAIFAAARYLGGEFRDRLPTNVVGPNLPTTLAGVFDLLRGQLNLVESLVAALRAADFGNWKTAFFVYLLLCLTIRMAPFKGTMRGALVAVILLGAGAAAVTTLFDVADPRIQSAWSILNLTVAALLLLLYATLLVRGFVGLVQVFRTRA